MAPQAGFGAFVDIDSTISSPPMVLQKDSHALPDLPTAFELDELRRTIHDRAPSLPNTSGTQTPRTPHELESSRPPSPQHHDTAEVMQTWTNPPINRWRLLSACLMNFGNGLNDAAPGALIPYMEKEYRIGYAIVSLIFVTNAVGFIAAAPFSHALQARLGRAKTLVLAEAVMVAAYVMLVCRPPFPVVVAAFLFLGLGIATNLSPNNVFCANLANPTTSLGCLHGAYGIGATIGPLMATALVTHGRPWSTFYFVSLSITLANLVLAFFSFRTYELDTAPPNLLHPTRSNPTPSAQAASNRKPSLLTAALTNRTTVLGALFIFCYQGLFPI